VTMARFARRLGTLLLVAGMALLLWSLVVWRWQDPFTALYTLWQQHQLAQDYDRLAASYRGPRLVGSSLATVRREIAREARRYRLRSKRGAAIGRIVIRRLDLNMVLVNGTDHDSLKKGPGRDLRTFMPGEGQLIYIAGHRTTYSAPFAHIEELRRGDLVTLTLPYATVRYRITRHVVVRANDLSRLKSHGREVVALQACHPRFFATHRYIAYARPVEIELRGGRAYSLTSETLAAAG
jgi:sortase A